MFIFLGDYFSHYGEILAIRGSAENKYKNLMVRILTDLVKFYEIVIQT